jgi:glycosyltransferase involved in cell wall biosynthesis
MSEAFADARVAIVHDWLTVYAGAERVLEQMLHVLPQANLYSLVDFLPEGQRNFIQNKPVTTSFLQGLPLAKKHYRNYLPLMPLAIEQFDLSGYDLVVSSSHAVAKGVLTGPDQLHICMCYSPIRYAWDLQHQYLEESGLTRGLKGAAARTLLHRVRLWDARTPNGVDEFIAISRFIARRIYKVYRRGSTIIYPPVDTGGFELRADKEDFYLTASRMVPYKKIDLIVEAFSGMPERRLVVIGDGPDFEKVKAKAGPNVQLMGFQPFSVLKDHMQRARAFVFAAEEDFGIVPLEAQACGTPVIAYGKGGSLETVRGLDSEAPTGVYFDAQTVASVQEAVRRFETAQFDPAHLQGHAESFSVPRFRDEFSRFVGERYRKSVEERR